MAAFQSSLAALMEQFVEEKRACGYQYDEPTRILGRFDHFLSDAGLNDTALPRNLTQQWLANRPTKVREPINSGSPSFASSPSFCVGWATLRMSLIRH